jgi:hypothetical protein
MQVKGAQLKGAQLKGAQPQLSAVEAAILLPSQGGMALGASSRGREHGVWKWAAIQEGAVVADDT